MENTPISPTEQPPTTGLNVPPPSLGTDPSLKSQDYKPYGAPPDKSKKTGLWIGIVLGLLLILGVVLYVVMRGNGHSTAKQPAGSSAANSSAGTPTSGTDNASLDQDMKDLTTSINKGDQDQTGVTTSVSDQQNQIQVPTN